MRSKITVVDAPGVAEKLKEGDWAAVVGPEALPGSDVVVAGPGVDIAELGRRVASRASGAAIIVIEPGALKPALEASFFTRGRVFSVPAERVREAAEAVIFDRCSTLPVTLVGLDDEVATEVPVILGAGGVREIRE
jgi:hypothetical protein